MTWFDQWDVKQHDTNRVWKSTCKTVMVLSFSLLLLSLPWEHAQAGVVSSPSPQPKSAQTFVNPAKMSGTAYQNDLPFFILWTRHASEALCCQSSITTEVIDNWYSIFRITLTSPIILHRLSHLSTFSLGKLKSCSSSCLNSCAAADKSHPLCVFCSSSAKLGYVPHLTMIDI